MLHLKMAPTKCLGRLHDGPVGDKLYEVSGKVKYTGLKIASSILQPGKVCIYNNKGSCSIVVEPNNNKTQKKFKLTNNIKQVTTRNENFTLVLNDGYQVITKECPPEDLKNLELYIKKIKNGNIPKGGVKIKSKVLPDPTDEFAYFEDIKENIHLKKVKQPRSRSPLVAKAECLIPDSSSYETPTKSPLLRKRSSATRGRIGNSPADQKSFEIVESRTVTAASPSEGTSPWSRPPNEKRSHSPSLWYGCRSSSPTSTTSPLSSRMKKQGCKTPLLDISPLKQRNNSTYNYGSPTKLTYVKASDENVYKPKVSYGSPFSSGSKKRSDARRFLDASSPLKPKAIQFGDTTSTPKFTQNKLSGEETTTHKATNFYGSSPSTSAFRSSFSGKTKRKFADRYRQLPFQSQTGTRGKFVPYTFHRRVKETSESPGNQIALTGFANLGNTCYMNAILQCILGIPTFAQDLDNQLLLRGLSNNTLYRCLYNLSMAKRSCESQDKQRDKLRSIKRAISNQAARFSGYSQHDAHEFLGQCLDQLKEDTMKLMPKPIEESKENETENAKRNDIEAACPVARNFECVISHTIECRNCGERITREEKFHDFSLDIPDIDENTDPEDKDLQDLLEDYFQNESVGYKCEECGCGDANLSHHFKKLPRVIILHLKRYGLDVDSTKCKKKLDTVDVPNELNLGVLCTEKTADPMLFERIAKSDLKQAVISNESPDEIEDFQQGLKVRRRLSLPPEPRLTVPDDGDAFDQELEQAKKLSLEAMNLDTMTEDEQMEWAMMESIKADETFDFLANPELMDIPRNLLESDSFEENKKSRNETVFTGLKKPFGEQKTNFTGVRSKAGIDQIVEKTEVCFVKNKMEKLAAENEDTPDLFAENSAKKMNNDDKMLIEGVSLLESEEEQLSMALERSLQEYNQLSASKCIKPQTKRKLEENKSENIKRKKTQTPQIANVPPKKYRLIGIVSHMGDSSNMGHYISDVFDCKGQEWKSYNDSAVKKVTEYEVRYGRKRCAYIFFYINEECFKAINQS